MAIQWGGFRPDKTAGYASALAALMGEQTRRRGLEADIESRDKGPDLWKRGFMEKELAQQKELSELTEQGRMERFTPPTGRPLSGKDQALQALLGGGFLPGVGELGTRKLAGVQPDWFTEMMFETKKGDERREKGRVESSPADKTMRQKIWEAIQREIVGDPLANLPERFERVAD